jgi:AraC-like DNA-binding protein
MSERYTLDKYKAVIDLLINSEKTFADIARELHCSLSHVKKINDGGVKMALYIFEDVQFPIRESKQTRNKKIMDDLENGMSVKEASQKYEMADSTIRTITYRENNKRGKQKNEK